MAHPGSDTQQQGRHAAPLNRAQLVDASLRLLEETGAEAFSMRRLAAELGIKSPSLYWHVKSKEELLDLVADDVLGTCPVPDPHSSDWAGALPEFTRRLRHSILEHPGAAPLLVGRIPLGPNGLRLADSCLGLLKHAGFNDDLAADAYMVLVFYAVGFAAQEITFGRGPEARARLAQMSTMLSALPADRYPHLVSAARSFTAPGRLNDRFEIGLSDLIRGLQTRLGTPGSSHTAAAPQSTASRPRRRSRLMVGTTRSHIVAATMSRSPMCGTHEASG
jgi:TetR/AcrR family transcriptional regulator, tetracycline repressor protein